MKKMIKLLRYLSGLIMAFLIIALSSTCSSDSEIPTSPSIPGKKTAIINIAVNKEPIVVGYSSILGYGVCEPTITVTESNGVGISVQTIRIEFCIGSYVYDSLDLSARRLEAYGFFRLKVFRQIYSQNFSRLKVNVQGKDDNGHSISKTQDFALTYFFF